MHPSELNKRKKDAEGRLLAALEKIGSEVGIESISLPNHRDSDVRGMMAMQVLASYAERIANAAQPAAPTEESTEETASDKPKRGRKRTA